MLKVSFKVFSLKYKEGIEKKTVLLKAIPISNKIDIGISLMDHSTNTNSSSWSVMTVYKKVTLGMYIPIKQGKEPGFKADKETAQSVSQIQNPQK